MTQKNKPDNRNMPDVLFGCEDDYSELIKLAMDFQYLGGFEQSSEKGVGQFVLDAHNKLLQKYMEIKSQSIPKSKVERLIEKYKNDKQRIVMLGVLALPKFMQELQALLTEDE